MTEAQRNTAVGIFVLIGFGLLAGIILSFSNLAALARGGYTIEVRLNHSAGTMPGKLVHFNGVEVGSVESVGLVADGVEVALVLKINRGTRIPGNAELNATSTGFGDTYLDIRLPTDALGRPVAPGTPVAQDGTARLKGVSGGSQLLPKSLTDRLEEFMTKFDYLDAAIRNLAEMTEPRTPAEVDSGAKPPNLSATVARFDATMARVADDQNARNLKELLANMADVSADLKRTVADADVFFSKAAGSVDKITADVDDVKEKSNRLLGKLYDDAMKLSNLLGTMNSLAKGLQEGKGTAGKLLVSDELHKQLELMLVEAQLAFKEFRILMTKLEKEGVFRSGG